MKVKALKNLIWRGNIYDAGAEFEIDQTTAYVLQKKGLVDLLTGKLEPAVDMVEVAGLPSLEEETKARKKK